MVTINEFYAFLVEQGCLFDFVSQLHNKVIFRDYFERHYQDQECYFLIRHAFSWALSKEGFKYWETIDDRWCEKYNKIKHGYS